MTMAAAQVKMNMPTMTKPALLMSKLYMNPQKPVVRLRPPISCGNSPAAHPPGETPKRPPPADEEADGDRQAGDREVVVHLANRVEERPAVGEVHEQPVGRVEQRHPGREQDRQAHDRVPRDMLR